MGRGGRSLDNRGAPLAVPENATGRAKADGARNRSVLDFGNDRTCLMAYCLSQNIHIPRLVDSPSMNNSNEGSSVSLYAPSPLIQENITSAVGWMTGDDDFLAQVYLSTPSGRIQMNFGDTHRRGGVVRLKALVKAIATAKDNLKSLPLKQRLLFKLSYSGRGNRQLSTDLQEMLNWADSQGLLASGMMFNQVLSKNIAESFIWLGFPDPKAAVVFKLAGYDHTLI
jgi:hypothetical protein